MLKQVILAALFALSGAMLAVGVAPATSLAASGRADAKQKQRGGSKKGIKKSKQSSKAKKARRARKASRIRGGASRATDVKAAAEAERSERKEPAAFTWTARPDAVDMDSRADVKRDEAIAKLKRLLPTMPAGPQKAELLFRLSEMYWAKSRYMHMRAMNTWDQALQRWHEAGSVGREPKVADMPEHGHGAAFREEALGLYDRILKDYPTYDRKDEVLYNLGSSLYEAGNKRRGVSHYWRLIKQYPNSDFAPDAWLQLGEHFFKANKLTQAVKAYSKAAQTKKPRIYSYALYMLAWCDYNLQEYPAALQKFRQVVEYAKRQKAAATVEGSMGERDRIQLMEEALNDMVRAYSHLDAVDDAFEYYEMQLGKDAAYAPLHRLARLYGEEGKHPLEIIVYKRLNDLHPYRAEAPKNQTAIMSAFANLGNNDEVRKEARRLVELYAPNGVWAQRNAGDKEVLEEAFDAVEQELSAVVTEQHRAAQSTKLVETYKLARDLYADYLSKFDASVNSYAFRFYYAEILFELKQFEQAAVQYTQVVERKRDGKFAKPAAYTAILAWEKELSGVKETLGKRIVAAKRGKKKGALRRLEQIRTLKKGERYDPTELSATERALADACDRFVEVAPKDDEVVKVKFKSARLYYIHNHFEEAAARFGEIIDRWPNDRLARLGAESILQSFNVRKDWTNLNKWARKFRTDRKLMADSKFKRAVLDFVEGASFNEILFVYEPKGDALGTADHYAQFVGEFPKSKYVLVAAYNAIVNYDKANVLEKAMEEASRVLSDYATFEVSAADIKASSKDGSALPKAADIREKVTFLQASFYERLARFDAAADLYERYVKNFPKGPKRADAMFNAALFREGLGESDKAVANYQLYIKEFSTREDIPDLAWRVGTIYEKVKNAKGARDAFSNWGKVYGAQDPARRLCASFKVVQALEAEGRASEAQIAYPKLVAAFKELEGEAQKDGCALEAAASSAFKLLEPAFQSYMDLELKGSEKTVAANLTKKLAEVEQLQQSYTDVLGIGHGDYGIASLYRVGQVYRDLAEDIFSSPCPKRLDEDQCSIYQAMLQEKAFPLEEKSIEAFDKALAKAYELGLYNAWLAKTQDALKSYEPTRFPPVQVYDLIASETVSELPKLVEGYR